MCEHGLLASEPCESCRIRYAALRGEVGVLPAFSVCTSALGPLNDEQRSRVLRAAAILFGVPL
jgi:hypothetical protein